MQLGCLDATGTGHPLYDGDLNKFPQCPAYGILLSVKENYKNVPLVF